MPRTGRPRSFDDDHVVQHSKDLFWQRGYTATSMRDLGDELGILPGSLYGAFGDKHTLFVRALARYAHDGQREVSALLADGPVLARIRELLESVLIAARTAPGRGCMLGNTAAEVLPGDEAAGQVVRDAFHQLEDTIQQALERAQQAGELRANMDWGVQARLLVAVMQGLHIRARAEPDPDRLHDIIDAALKPLQSARAPSSDRTPNYPPSR